MEHPNLEVLQITERVKSADFDEAEEEEEAKPKKKKAKPLKNAGNEKLPICKGIQVRMQQNTGLKKLELRFIPLNRHFLQAIFKGLAKNTTLQKLILTNETLTYAT